MITSTSSKNARQELAPTWLDDAEDVLLGLLPWLLWGLVIAAVWMVALLLVWIQPAWLAELAASLAGTEPKVYWYLSRSSAMVSYGLLWLSMALGLAITNKLARIWPGGPTFAALHEHASWLGLGLAVFHVLVLLGDGYIGYTLPQLLVPFAGADYRPVWVGLGQVALYLLVLVVLSFSVQRWIGYRLWRLIHYLSFGMFVLALAHGLFSGTDSAAPWAQGLYAASALSLAGLALYRVARARRPRPMVSGSDQRTQSSGSSPW